jgi:hypothetical protein
MKIKNLSYPVPTIGRIAIGEKKSVKGKSLPSKADHFIITTQTKNANGWISHPIANEVCKKTGQNIDSIREIPIRFMFNKPELNIRTRYEAFSNNGRTICAGDGEKGKRRMADGSVGDVVCMGAEYCEFAKDARCKVMTRLNVQIDVSDLDSQESEEKGDDAQALKKDHEFDVDWFNDGSTFILRSTGFNTARTLQSKIAGFHALLGGNLVGVPFKLKLRSKTSAMSMNSIFFYVDVVPALPMMKSAEIGMKIKQRMIENGMDQAAYEETVMAGLSESLFEDSPEEEAEAFEYNDFGVSDVPEDFGDQADDPKTPSSVLDSLASRALNGKADNN